MLAVAVAVGIYFALQPYVGTEEIGWMCILGAAPFAACGFFHLSRYDRRTGAVGVGEIRNSLPETPCVQVRQLLLRSHAARHPCGHKAKERFAYEEKYVYQRGTHLIKTLTKAQKLEREKFRIPRSVQDAIPIRRIFADGIFQVGNQYSKTWSFTDINYAIVGKEDKTAMFLDYSELLNALDSGASAKITIYNRRINKAEFEKSVLLPDKADGLDEYRHEFNKMLTAQVTGTSNSIVRERYLTVSVVKRNADEARSYFSRVGTDLVTHLAQLSSVASELTLNERLHIFRDFFSRPGNRLRRSSISTNTPSAASISRIGSAPTAWSLPPTISRLTPALVGCCICRTTPATSRTALCPNFVILTAT